MVTDYYGELAIDLLTASDLGLNQTTEIVAYLRDNGLLDYDVLKEFYEDA